VSTMLRPTIGTALTRRELAEELRVSSQTIRRWERQGMPFLPWGRRLKRYILADVRAWLDGGGANGDS
jgi:transcriptional regulator with XRE-family HTH domain